jgi:carboxymethylenebutenolidase
MCYDDKAQPPQPPVEGGEAHGKDLVLTASDGTQFMAYQADPAHPTGAQVIILPDIRGLHQFYKELALRFAEIGIRALALDYFGRTAGLGSRDESFVFMPHVEQTQIQSLYDDISTSIKQLRSTASNESLFVMGFCFGGTLALISSREDFGQAGGIGFYAGIRRQFPGTTGTLLDLAHEITHPVLGLFGEADQGIPVNKVQQLDEELDKAGVDHEIVIYPGAPHSFFDRHQATFAEESNDAWKRVLNFINMYK